MALVTFPLMAVPAYIYSAQGNSTITPIDAAGELAAWVFNFPATGTLKKICFYTDSTTCTATQIDVEVQNVGADGHPDGTLYATGATGVVSTPAASTGYWVAINSTTGISVTQGTLAAVVIKWNNGSFGVVAGPSNSLLHDFPYALSYLGSTWTALTAFGLSLEYSTGIVQIVGAFPACLTSATTTISQTSHRGNRIRFPYKCRVIGTWVMVDADGSYDIILYGSDGFTVLGTAAGMTGSYRGGTAILNQFLRFPTSITLEKDTYYRVVLKPTSATTIGFRYYDVVDDGAYYGLDAAELGQYCHYTSATATPTQESDWTNTNTRRLCIGLILDAIDIGGGVGLVGSGLID